MEAQKIKGEAKSLILDSGIELTYCERGEKKFRSYCLRRIFLSYIYADD